MFISLKIYEPRCRDDRCYVNTVYINTEQVVCIEECGDYRVIRTTDSSFSVFETAEEILKKVSSDGRP